MNIEKIFYEKTGEKYDVLMSNNNFQYFIQRRKEILKSLQIKDKGSLILDLGCGTGIYKDAFTNDQIVIGSDYSFSALKCYKDKWNQSKLINSDACFIPLKSNSIDLIIVFGLIHHLYSKVDLLLTEIKRVLRKGGLVIIDEPNGYNVLWFLLLSSEIGKQIDGGITKLVTPTFLKKKLKKHNFKIHFQKHWGILPPSFIKLNIFSSLNYHLERSPFRVFSIRFTIIGIKSE